MRSRGIGVQQIFGKLAGFFSTNVNSIALDAIKWRYLAIYCGWIFFEFCIVYLLYPETSGRTLEELAFRMFSQSQKFQITALTDHSLRGRGTQGEDRCCCREADSLWRLKGRGTADSRADPRGCLNCYYVEKERLVLSRCLLALSGLSFMNITSNCGRILWSATAIDTFKEYTSNVNVM
jgi:hypothetical protein